MMDGHEARLMSQAVRRRQQRTQEIVDRLEEIRNEMTELVGEAMDLLRGTRERERARSYWYAHILGALDKEGSPFIGGSMYDMTETIEALREQAEEIEGRDLGKEERRMTQWAVEPFGDMSLVVIERQIRGDVVHKRVMASVSPEDTESTLARLKEKYGPAGERLPDGFWGTVGAKESLNQEDNTMATKRKKTQKKSTKKRSSKKKANAKTNANAKANSKNAIPESKLKEIVGRLEAGESKLIEESRGLGFKGNNELRAALREHMGGKAPYRAMIERSMAARKGSDDNGGGKKKRKRKSKAKKK